MEIGWVLGVLAVILVGCVVLWAASKLMAAWGIGDPIATTVYVILVILFAVVVASRFGLVHV